MKIAPGPGAFGAMKPQEVARLSSASATRSSAGCRSCRASGLGFVSDGVPITGSDPLFWTAVPETMRLIDHAIRPALVMSAVDSLGLLAGDVALTSATMTGTPTSRAWAFQMSISDGTGGRFMRDTNDLDGAVRQLAATPEFIYVLGFSPDTAAAKSGSTSWK